MPITAGRWTPAPVLTPHAEPGQSKARPDAHFRPGQREHDALDQHKRVSSAVFRRRESHAPRQVGSGHISNGRVFSARIRCAPSSGSVAKRAAAAQLTLARLYRSVVDSSPWFCFGMLTFRIRSCAAGGRDHSPTLHTCTTGLAPSPYCSTTYRTLPFRSYAVGPMRLRRWSPQPTVTRSHSGGSRNRCPSMSRDA